MSFKFVEVGWMFDELKGIGHRKRRVSTIKGLTRFGSARLSPDKKQAEPSPILSTIELAV